MKVVLCLNAKMLHHYVTLAKILHHYVTLPVICGANIDVLSCIFDGAVYEMQGLAAFST